MARTKERWVAYFAGGMILDGRTVVIPMRLTNDPDRIVELRIPASQAERFLRGFVAAAETDPADMVAQAEQEDEESSAPIEPVQTETEPPIARSVRAPRNLGRYLEDHARAVGRHAVPAR